MVKRHARRLQIVVALLRCPYLKMFKQMQFFRKIKFSSIPVCIEICQNIVTSGRKFNGGRRTQNLDVSLWKAYLV